jgi:hypothetical protein
MSAKQVRIQRAIKFWENKTPAKFLLTEQTISLLGNSLGKLRSAKVFTLEHAHAMALSVSLIEAQMRDCVRLKIDNVGLPADLQHKFLKDDLNIDLALFATLRGYKFSLGEFVFMNIGISTVAQLWSAMDFCFGSKKDQEKYFNHYITENKLNVKDNYIIKLKSSLARVYMLRNTFIHEFFDFTAEIIGSVDEKEITHEMLQYSFDFLRWTQWMKVEQFSDSYPEPQTPRGEIGKNINQSNARIGDKIKRIDRFLRQQNGNNQLEERDKEFLDGLRRNFKKVQISYKEYSECASEFIYYAVGPGTLAIDAAFGRKLADLQNFEQLLDRAIESKRIPE